MAAATPSGILSILITLGGDGRVEWMRWGERGGENRTHKGRLKKAAERLRGRENTRTNRSPRNNNIFLLELFSGTEFEFEDCYSFHP